MFERCLSPHRFRHVCPAVRPMFYFLDPSGRLYGTYSLMPSLFSSPSTMCSQEQQKGGCFGLGWGVQMRRRSSGCGSCSL